MLVIERGFTIRGISVETFLRDKCFLMFEEVSSGVYQVVKDRNGIHFKYVDSRLVANSMHHYARVVIKRLDGKFVINENSLEGF